MTVAPKVALVALLLLGACGQSSKQLTCPDPSSVAPPSIGAAFVNNLTTRLAGPDRENSITEAIGEIHRRDPSLDATAVTNILVAADCPNVMAQPDHDANADRARIAVFRAQVDQLLGS